MLPPIGAPSGPARTGRAAAPRGTSGSFGAHLPAEAPPTPTAGTADSVAATGLEALLGAQEHAAESPRDRAARRHGQESLKLLRALQQALLAGEPDPATLTRLAAHAAAMPSADDPRLAAVQRAIAQRVAVELGRRGVRYNNFP